jgi:hypothetical protein
MLMKGKEIPMLERLKLRGPSRLAILMLLTILIFAVTANGQTGTALGQAKPATTRAAGQIESLSAAEFSRLSREFSEEGGYFRSDNFTSNETPYLHVVDKLRQLGATGGAYLGVGPEQNFTYIAKIRPRIAFLVDIRRQAIIQHLMYKAVFHLSPDRVQFLSRLLSRPLSAAKKDDKIPGPNASANELVAFFSGAPADDKAYADNLAAIRQMIQKDFQFPLSEADQSSLEYVYRCFREAGLEISFRFGDRNDFRGGNFPGLKDLMLETDLSGKQGNFLASSEDYDFVRGMHRKNLIIPVVGDFGGKKALAAVGDYLRQNGYTVTAFYLSNVEQYLFENGVFGAFAANIKKLPITERSLFIRSASGRVTHPARLPGHRSATLLQLMAVFLKDFDAGRYQSHYDLVMTNFIAPDKPQ